MEGKRQIVPAPAWMEASPLFDAIREKWIEEGETKGEVKKANEMARKLLRGGVAVDVIVEASGLTVAEVKELKRQLDETSPLFDGIREKWIEEGETKGEAKKARDMAKNLLSRGVAVDIIVEASGLTVAEVEDIKKQLEH